MKEQAIQKINKIGKVSGIFALICKILLGIAIVCLIISMVGCFMIPERLLTITTTANTKLEMEMSSVGESLSDEELPEAQEVLSESLTAEMEDAGTDGYVTNVAMTNDKVEIDMTTEEFTFNMRDGAGICMALLVYVAMTMVTVCFISSLCKAFRDCQSPFEEGVIKKMQNFAYSLIPWALISSITDSVANSMMRKKISINLSVDLGVILIVLVVFLIVYIFKYGAVLQQESDETL